MTIRMNRKEVSLVDLRCLFKGESVLIGADTSKTHSSITVFRIPTKQIIGVLEFESPASEDILDYLPELLNSLKYIFEGADIQFTFIEDLVTRKAGDYHHARTLIAGVFYTVTTCFKLLGSEVVPVNNMIWKKGILGEAKGKDVAVNYMIKNYPELYVSNLKNDDVADSICIGLFGRTMLRAYYELSFSTLPDYPLVYEFEKSNPTSCSMELRVSKVDKTLIAKVKKFRCEEGLEKVYLNRRCVTTFK